MIIYLTIVADKSSVQLIDDSTNLAAVERGLVVVYLDNFKRLEEVKHSDPQEIKQKIGESLSKITILCIHNVFFLLYPVRSSIDFLWGANPQVGNHCDPASCVACV